MTHKPETTKRVHAELDDATDRFGLSPIKAVQFLLDVKASLIADDAADGTEQWEPRIEDYRYLRDLRDTAESERGRAAAEGITGLYWDNLGSGGA